MVVGGPVSVWIWFLCRGLVGWWGGFFLFVGLANVEREKNIYTHDIYNGTARKIFVVVCVPCAVLIALDF